MKFVALTILALAVIALVTGNLDHFFPDSRQVSVSSNSVEAAHTRLRAVVVIVAACVVVISSVAAYIVLP